MIIAITGEVGLGKTTILRSYLERVDPKQLRTIYIFNANGNAHQPIGEPGGPCSAMHQPWLYEDGKYIGPPITEETST